MDQSSFSHCVITLNKVTATGIGANGYNGSKGYNGNSEYKPDLGEDGENGENGGDGETGGDGGSALGGGIWSAGDLTTEQCKITGNGLKAGNGGNGG